MHDDQAVRDAVRRLSRRHPSGGRVIERAALLASGHAAAAMMAWVEQHGTPEALPEPVGARGLHGDRASAGDVRRPLRYVLPADAFPDGGRGG